MSPSKTSTDRPASGELVKWTSSAYDDTVDILVVNGTEEFDPPSSLSILDEEFDAVNVRSLPSARLQTSNVSSPDIILFNGGWNLNAGEADLHLLRKEHSDSLLVALVTPEVDCDHIEGKVDELLVRPVTEQSDVIPHLLRQHTFQELVDKHRSLASELVTLEEEKSAEQLETDERYSTLREEIAEVESQRDVLISVFTSEDFSRLFKEFSG